MSVQPPSSDQDAYLDLDGVRANLAQRSARSGVVRVGGRGAQMLLGIGSAMILARLLTPEDFGLLVLANLFLALVNSFRDMGLKMATVHHDDLTQEQISGLFWFNLKLSIAVLIFMLLIAPAFAWLYNDPRLIAIVAVLALGVLALSLSTQHEAVLMRQMRFELLASIEAGSLLLGMVAGILAAFAGWGYWALVLQMMVTNLGASLGLWLLCSWRPLRLRKPVSILPMLRYGGNYTAYNILKTVSDNLDTALVGLTSGVAAAGLYQNAFRWAFTPVLQVYTPLQGVAVASMSRVQQDAPAYRAAYHSGLLPVFSLTLPLLVFMAAESRVFILTLLGPQWMAAIPLFRWLCVAAIAASFSQVTSWIYLSQGSTHRQLRWGLIATPLLVIGIVVGFHWGALGIAIGYTTVRCLLLLPEIAFCTRYSPLNFSDFLRPAWRPALASLAALVILLLAGYSLTTRSLVVQFAVMLSLFALTFALTWLLLPGGRVSAGRLFHLIGAWRVRRASQPATPTLT